MIWIFLDYRREFHYNILSYGYLYVVFPSEERIFNMAKEYKITSLRLADLEKELNYLKTGLVSE